MLDAHTDFDFPPKPGPLEPKWQRSSLEPKLFVSELTHTILTDITPTFDFGTEPTLVFFLFLNCCLDGVLCGFIICVMCGVS